MNRAGSQEQSGPAREGVPEPLRQMFQHEAAHPEQIGGLRDRQVLPRTTFDREAQCPRIRRQQRSANE